MPIFFSRLYSDGALERVATDWPLIRLGHHVSIDSSSSACLAKARKWIDRCVSEHGNENCPPTTGGPLPSRLIDVVDATTNPHLYESAAGERGTWAALSYCWGPESATRFTTTSHSLASMKDGFTLDQLPKTCRDAVLAARGLHIQYIWIDALCIIQDSRSDWEKESARMCNIYENALVTFAAIDSLTSDSGLFRASSARKSRKLSIKLSNGEYGDVFVRQPYLNVESMDIPGNDCLPSSAVVHSIGACLVMPDVCGM